MSKIARHWRVLAGLLISATFIYWALRQVHDLTEVGVHLRDANYVYVVPGLVVYFVGVWLRALRWHFLTRPLKPIPVANLFPVVAIGYMANNILPIRLGEIVRSCVLGDREQISRTSVLGTVLVERAFDGLAMLTFIGVVGFFVPFTDWLQNVFRLAGAFFIGAVLIFFFVVSARSRVLRLLGMLLRALPETIRTRADNLAGLFLSGFEALRSVHLVAMTFALSIGAWLAEATMYYVIARGFDLNLGFSAYALTTAVANLATMIPSSPGYVGTFDTAALLALRLFGASPEIALSFVVTVHIALLVPITLLGLFYLWRYGLSLRSLSASRLSDAEQVACVTQGQFDS